MPTFHDRSGGRARLPTTRFLARRRREGDESPPRGRIGFHIADVSRVLRAAGLVDRGPTGRGAPASYVPGAVEPIASPRRCRTTACSLVPGQDRLCRDGARCFDRARPGHRAARFSSLADLLSDEPARLLTASIASSSPVAERAHEPWAERSAAGKKRAAAAGLEAPGGSSAGAGANRGSSPLKSPSSPFDSERPQFFVRRPRGCSRDRGPPSDLAN